MVKKYQNIKFVKLNVKGLIMKGIILAGGSGSRLYPLTISVSKQLLPVYDKPMIFYPLSVLMDAGIRDILIISTPMDLVNYQKLLGSGNEFGVSLSYAEQPIPLGLAEAFLIGKKFIGNDKVCLILGDNIFYRPNFRKILRKCAKISSGASIFGCQVEDPNHFGVIEFDKNHKVISIEEKPLKPKSSYAITGLYFYDNDVIEIAKTIKPSARGELEITDVNKAYLEKNKLYVNVMDDKFTWLDAGTHKTLLKASNFIKMIEETKRIKIGCLEEIAYYNNWLSKRDLIKRGKVFDKTNNGKHLQKLVKT